MEGRESKKRKKRIIKKKKDVNKRVNLNSNLNKNSNISSSRNRNKKINGNVNKTTRVYFKNKDNTNIVIGALVLIIIILFFSFLNNVLKKVKKQEKEEQLIQYTQIVPIEEKIAEYKNNNNEKVNKRGELENGSYDFIKSLSKDEKRKYAGNLSVMENFYANWNANIINATEISDEYKEKTILEIYPTLKNLTFAIEIRENTEKEKITINWGDGQVDTTKEENIVLSHTYKTAKPYIVMISENVKSFKIDKGSESLMKVLNWGKLEGESMELSFVECSNLIYIAEITNESFKNLKTAENMFRNCGALREIPKNLFEYANNLENMKFFAGNCANLYDLNNMLIPSTVKNFKGAFQNNRTLQQNVPEIWNQFKGKDVIKEDCFKGTALKYEDKIPKEWR